MISIVIPAYNEEEHLAKCLAALCAQKTDEELEVIVVDNASTDSTTQIAESFAKRLNVRVIHEPMRGRGRARAIGSGLAKGEILFGIDAETVAPPEWIESFMEIFRRDPQVVGIVGTTWIDDCSAVTNKVHNVLWPFTLILFRIIHGFYSLSGHNFAVRKWTYELAGGFDPEFDAMEDVDLSFRVRPFGKIKLKRTAPVHISGRRFRRGFFLGWLEYIRSFLEIKLFNRKTVELAKVD